MLKILLPIGILCCGISLVHSETTTSVQSLLTDGIVELSVQFLNSLPLQNANLVFSPFNIYLTIGEIILGTYGQTQRQLVKTAQVDIPQTPNNIRKIFKAMDRLQESVEQMNPGRIQINIANGIFIQTGLELNATYNSMVSQFFNTTERQVDFAGHPTNAVKIINGIISEDTHGLIPSLFSQPLPTDTKLVFANALYFKAAWEIAFDADNTQEVEFFDGSGSIMVNMMNNIDLFPYYRNTTMGIQVVSLPYNDGAASLYLIRPCNNCNLQNSIRHITSDNIKQIINGTETTYVNVSIPVVNNEWASSDLKSQIMQLGATRIFTNNAETTFVTNETLKIDQFAHAAKIKINEKGTEAAAATGVSVTPTVAPVGPPKMFNLNRSFWYFIYHEKTEVILFAGIVNDPNGSGD